MEPTTPFGILPCLRGKSLSKNLEHFTMNTLLFSLLIAFNFSGNASLSTDDDCLCRRQIQKKYVYQHWVFSPEESKGGIITYRPYKTADANNITMHHKYSGMEIKLGGKLFQHRWRKCGNDRGPAGYDYQWQWKTEDKQTFLIIKKRRTYQVLELGPAKLVLMAVK